MINANRLNNKGIVLILTTLLIAVVSTSLAAYAIWSIVEQRHLFVKQQAEKAYSLAVAGLQQAKKDLFLDDNWSDGNINGNALNPSTPPAPNNPDQYFTLYNNISLGEGNYAVQIKYLQNPKSCQSGCSFNNKQVLLRSTGAIGGVSATLQEIVSWYLVKNLTQGNLYTALQPGVDDSNSNDRLAVTQAGLNENVNISGTNNFDIKGCYDGDFGFRDCMNYPTSITGNVTISGSAQVDMGGITIK